MSSQVKSPSRFERGLSRRAVEELSWLKDEPAWMRERRLAAWQAHEVSTGPTGREEEWRRTDLSLLRMDDAPPFAPSPLAGRSPEEWPREIRRLTQDREATGLLLQHNSESVWARLNEEAARQGVVWCSLDQAVRDYPDLVRDYLLREPIPEPDSKYIDLHAAFLSGGTFLYVPEGVDVALPLRAFVAVDDAAATIFPHTLMVVGRGSRVTVIEDHLSMGAAAASATGDVGFSNALVEIYPAEGADVRYVHVQRWAPHVRHLGFLRSIQERGSRVMTLSVGLGAGLAKGKVEAVLKGEGANSQVLGLFLPSESQHYDYVTLQDHVAPHSVSELLFKAAVKDRARFLYYGVTRVRKTARQSSAYQESRNLLLNAGAKADATPVLEIEAFDVLRCGHGATVGPVDEEQLFYLMTRGLPEKEAQRMIVGGFFQQVLERVPSDSLRREVMAAVEEKLSGLSP